MRTDVTEVDGRLDVLSALKIMKKVGATSLIVKRRDENDEYGMLLFSDIAKEVIAKKKYQRRTICSVRELCESVLMGCDESWVSQRAVGRKNSIGAAKQPIGSQTQRRSIRLLPQN